MSKGMNDKTSMKTIKLVRQIGPVVDWNRKENNQFLEAFLALKTKDEAKRFLRDIMTEKEIKEFANRLEAAKLLSEDIQYNAITEDTGLSSTTIARIQKWLRGSLGGYRLILNRLAPLPRQSSGRNYKIISHHHNSFKLRKGLSLSS